MDLCCFTQFEWLLKLQIYHLTDFYTWLCFSWFHNMKHCLNPYTGNGGVNYPPALFSLNLWYFQISHRDDFYDIVTDPLASLKLLKLFQCLLLLSGGMTGKSGRRLGNLPIPCVVQLYDFWKENNLLATSIHEYCGCFLLGKKLSHWLTLHELGWLP